MTDACCAPTANDWAEGAPVVVLIGNPNVGKSTLFNRVTGARQRVVNAPRTTVELATGQWRDAALPTGVVTLTDLPGAYDTDPASPDEQVTVDVLGGTRGLRPDVAIVLLDATALGRSLYLLAQVATAGVPIVVAVTMSDVAQSRGVEVSPARLRQELGLHVVELDPRTGHGRGELAAAVAEVLAGSATATYGQTSDRASSFPVDNDPLACLEWADATLRALYGPAGLPRASRSWTDRADRALLSPWVGIPVFLGVLWAMLQLVTTVAAPLMSAITRLWSGPVDTAVRAAIPGSGWWESAIADGVLPGVGVVLAFAPLMALTFVALAILEDSGYMARAAVVADRALRGIGLNGQATLPLIIGFGCNLPALAALKTLPNARQRLATGLLIPFTSCTARLPVYLLLASAFFPSNAGAVVFLMYVASAVVVIAGGLIMKRTLLRGNVPDATIMVLPAYQRPRVQSLLASAWARTRAFVFRAGTVIVIALSALWLLAAVPVGPGQFGAVAIEDSAYGTVADAVAPVFAPAGFDDWRLASALISGFVAKEVVVGVLAQSFALDQSTAQAGGSEFDEQLRATFEHSSGGYPQAAAAAFLIFVLMYTPCVATLAEMRRQLGWRWALAAVGVGLATAYVAAIAVFQVGRLL